MDRTPESSITNQNMWKTENEAVAGVNGLYHLMRKAEDDYPFLAHNELRTGFWTMGVSGGQQFVDYFNNAMSSSTTPYISWSNFYDVINLANISLKCLPNIDFSNANLKSTLIADVYFARAYTYFIILKLWGDAPLMLDPVESINSENLYTERSDKTSLLKQIKSDIESAISNLKDNSDRGRVKASLAALNMLKTDVYLWTAKVCNGGKNDLSVALESVNSVLSNNSYKFSNNYITIFREKENKEVIFSFYYNELEKTNHYGNRFIYRATNIPPALRDNPIPVGHNQWLKYSTYFVDNYLNNNEDSRRDVIRQEYKDENNYFEWVNKFLGEIVSGTRMATDNLIIYRITEAILFKAEILNALDRTDEAIIELNKIAKRAYSKDNYYAVGSKEEVDSLILRERIIEFAAEGKSWFDIIRFGKAFEMIPSLVGRENDNSGNVLLLPVDINILSRNLKLKQTEGFN